MKDEQTRTRISMGSVNRPAWLSDDLNAFNHRFSTRHNLRVKQENYYKDRRGLR